MHIAYWQPANSYQMLETLAGGCWSCCCRHSSCCRRGRRRGGWGQESYTGNLCLIMSLFWLLGISHTNCKAMLWCFNICIFVLFTKTMTCPFIIIMLTDMWGGSTFLAQQAEVLKQIRCTSPAPLNMHKLSSIQVMHSKDILTSPGRS